MRWSELEPEKYWQKNAKSMRDKREIYDRIDSGLYVSSLKKDGEYNRFIIEDGKAAFYGRGVSTVTGAYVENTARVPSFVDFLSKVFKDGTCILGEFYIPGKTSKDVRGIMGCLPAKAIARQKEVDLRFYIFDIWAINDQSCLHTSMEKRVDILEKIRPFVEKHPKIEVARYATTPESIMEQIAYAFNNDEEGCVLTLKNSVPSPGSRTSWKTMKIKKEFSDSIDVFFTGRSRETDKLYTGKELPTWSYWEDYRTGVKLEGQLFNDYAAGRTIEPVSKPYYYGWAKSLEIAVLRGDQEFSLGYVSSGLNEQIKEQFKNNPEMFIHRPAMIQGMQFTVDKQIRHPKFMGFRDETISWKDCTYEKIFGE